MIPDRSGDKGRSRFTLTARLRSFHYAGAGIAFMLKTQPNARTHLAIAVAVIAAAWYWEVSADDWRWLIVSIVLVWAAEALNTAIEYVCDVVSPDYHAAVARAKDIGAAAVLICAGGAAVLGALTLYPYL